MAETLTELVARIKVDATNLQKGLASAGKDVKELGKSTEKETKSIKERFLEVGKTATVMGAAITTAMGLMIRSFVKTGSELSDLALSTGISVEALAGLKYAAEQNGASLGTVTMAVRRVSAAMQDAKDGLAETKRAFDRMGLSLTELEGLKPEEQFLKIANAIAEIPDPMTRAATAQDLFGRSGMDMLPMLSQGADGLRKMMEEGVKLSGWSTESANLADALGDAFDTLKTAMTGIFNVIGASLAPALKGIADTLIEITGGVVEWIQAHPSLVKAISTATLAVGLFATGIGLASIAVKYLGTTTNLYFGGILILIGALVTGIVLLIDWFNRAGNAQKKLADEQKAALDKQMADDKAYFATKRANAQNASAQAIQAIRDEYGENEKLTKSKIQAAKDALAEELKLIQQKEDAAQDTYDKAIDLIWAEYGETKDAARSMAQVAKDTRDARIQALNDVADKARDVHRERLNQLEDEYRAGLNTIQRRIQTQIDALDSQTEAEDRELRVRRDNERIAELQSQLALEDDAERKKDIEKRLTEERQSIVRRDLLWGRDAVKDALRARLEAVRDGTDAEAINLRQETDAKIALEKEALDIKLANIETEKTAAETALADSLVRIGTERDALIAAEDIKLQRIKTNLSIEKADANKTLAEAITRLETERDKKIEAVGVQLDYSLHAIGKEETARRNSYDTQLNATIEWVKKMNAANAQLQDVEYIVTRREVTVRSSEGGGQTTSGFSVPELRPFATGGIVTQPTLAMIGEAGAEAVVPLNEAGGLGGITINFTQPVFFDREDTMNKFVDMIRKGIQRQDRLRFGGAFNG